MADLFTRYFLFSQSHYDKIKEIERRAGNVNYKPGTVLVGGYYRPFTSMETRPEKYTQMHGDAKTVLVGDIRKVKYTNPVKE